MAISAVLVAETVACGPGDELAQCPPGAEVFGLRNGDHIEGFAVGGMAEGTVRACVRYAIPDVPDDAQRPSSIGPGGSFVDGLWAVAPDGSFAVFGLPDRMVAVGADGVTRWVYEHAEAEDPEDCFIVRPCTISPDGKLVWALVRADRDLHDGDLWTVLDAATGEVVAQSVLEGMDDYIATQFVRPGGRQAAICMGMGQDGIFTYWGRIRDGGEVLDEDDDDDTPPNLDIDEEGSEERSILVAVSPAGEEFLTVRDDNRDLRRQSFGGEELATLARDLVPLGAPGDGWIERGGYLTADACLIVSNTDHESHPQPYQHWIFELASGELRGPILYPVPGCDLIVRCLGDGTWLTTDPEGTSLLRWRV